MAAKREELSYNLLVMSCDEPRFEKAVREFSKAFSLASDVAEQIVANSPIVFLSQLSRSEVKAIKKKLIDLSRHGLTFKLTVKQDDNVPKVNWPIRPQVMQLGGDVTTRVAFDWGNNLFACPHCKEVFALRRVGKFVGKEPAVIEEVKVAPPKAVATSPPTPAKATVAPSKPPVAPAKPVAEPAKPSVAKVAPPAPPAKAVTEPKVDAKLKARRWVPGDEARKRAEEIADRLAVEDEEPLPTLEDEGELLSLDEVVEEPLQLVDEVARPSRISEYEEERVPADEEEMIELGSLEEEPMKELEETVTLSALDEVEEEAPPIKKRQQKTEELKKPIALQETMKLTRAKKPEVPEEGEGEEAEEEYNVFLSKIATKDKRAAAVKLLMQIRKISEDEAKELTSRMIIPVLKGVSKQKAEETLQKFKALGITGRITKKK